LGVVFCFFSIWNCYVAIRAHVCTHIAQVHMIFECFIFLNLMTGPRKKCESFHCKRQKEFCNRVMCLTVSTTHFVCACVHLDALVLSCNIPVSLQHGNSSFAIWFQVVCGYRLQLKAKKATVPLQQINSSPIYRMFETKTSLL